jgi:hypothetical protein
VLADAGFASGAAVKTLQDRTIAPLVAIAKIQPHRPYDFRPPPDPKPERQITEPWPIAMKAKLEATMPKRATKAENKPWRPSSASSKGLVKRHRQKASSKAPWDFAVSCGAASTKSKPNGRLQASPTIAGAWLLSGRPAPPVLPPKETQNDARPTGC